MCLDCSVDTGKLNEFYYLDLKVWLKVHQSKTGMLCIGCLETRLGRQVTSKDFTKASINDPKYNTMSTRLVSRIRNTG